MEHITPLFHELHWLPVFFWVKFNVLVLSFKALHGIRPGYLRDCLFPFISVHSIRLIRRGILWVLSTEFHLVGSRWHAFYAVAFALWNIIPLPPCPPSEVGSISACLPKNLSNCSSSTVPWGDSKLSSHDCHLAILGFSFFICVWVFYGVYCFYLLRASQDHILCYINLLNK